MPSGDHPHKRGDAIEKAHHRLAMCRLAFAGIEGLVIDDREIQRSGPAFTVTTLEETRLLEVCKAAFGRVLETKPSLVEEIGAALRERMAERSRAIAGQEQAATDPAQDIFRRIHDFFSM
jgi:CRP-like cAMP-binding protein